MVILTIKKENSIFVTIRKSPMYFHVVRWSQLATSNITIVEYNYFFISSDCGV